MAQQHGLGRGLSSLIPPKQPENAPIAPKQAHAAATPLSKKALPKKGVKTNQKAAPVTVEGQHEEGQRVVEVPVGKIIPNPHQPRADFVEERLHELAESIRVHGILQPLTATKRGDSYELIAGERRFQAAKRVGLKTVPVIVRDAKEQQKFELAIIENVQRHDLNPIEEAKAYRRLIDEFNLTQEDVAQKMGKSRSLVANTLRLLQLPAEIQRALLAGEVSEGHAKAILALEGLDKQMALFEVIRREKLTVREAEARSREVTDKPRRKSMVRSPEIEAKEAELSEVLGTRVRIARAGKGGKITIEYYNPEDLEQFLTRFQNT